MIRFSTFSAAGNISGGVPYVNTDFSHVLQLEHLKSYRSVLDGMNEDSVDPAEPLNSGIILKGIIWGIYVTNQYFSVNLQNAIVYINGEFYQSDPNLGSGLTINSTTFYIVPGSPTNETRPTRSNMTTSTSVFSKTTYFTYQTTLPTTPYIKVTLGNTSRRYERILKYFTSRVGEIYCTTDVTFFNGGVGFGPMEGFIILDNRQNDSPDLAGKFLRNKKSMTEPIQEIGNNIHRLDTAETSEHSHDTTGPLFSRDWSNTSAFPPKPFDPTHIHFYNTSFTDYNYYDGSKNPSPVTQPNSLVENPDDQTGFPVSDTLIFADETNTQFPPARTGYNTRFANDNTGSLFKYATWLENSSGTIQSPQNSRYTDFATLDELTDWANDIVQYNYGAYKSGGIYDYPNSQLRNHIHTVPFDLGSKQKGDLGLPHENRPPYFVMIYYTKKPY